MYIPSCISQKPTGCNRIKYPIQNSLGCNEQCPLLHGEVHLSPFHILVYCGRKGSSSFCRHSLVDFLSIAEDLMVRNVALLSVPFLLREHNLGCSILERLVRQLAPYRLCTQPRSELAHARLPCWRQPCQKGNADAFQSSKELLARIYIRTLFPVRGADLTQSSPARAVELVP